MPSPFPGMDPFLENPAIFPDLHDGLIAYLREALQARLPEPYFAAIGSQVWVEVTQRYIGPDFNVLRPNGGPVGGQGSSGGVAVATAARTQPVVIRVPHDERRQTRVDIFTPQEGGKLVTTIEVLSPANKMSGEHGRDLYVRKQREVLYGHINLVEIDLLRGGQHTTAVPRDRAAQEAGPFDYHVCIHRSDNLEDFFVYPLQLADRLPEIAIPLLPGDADVPIDLQAVFDRSYDAGAYRRRVRYGEALPAPPLRPEQLAWAAQRLREQGVAVAWA